MSSSLPSGKDRILICKPARSQLASAPRSTFPWSDPTKPSAACHQVYFISVHLYSRSVQCVLLPSHPFCRNESLVFIFFMNVQLPCMPMYILMGIPGTELHLGLKIKPGIFLILSSSHPYADFNSWTRKFIFLFQYSKRREGWTFLIWANISKDANKQTILYWVR